MIDVRLPDWLKSPPLHVASLLSLASAVEQHQHARLANRQTVLRRAGDLSGPHRGDVPCLCCIYIQRTGFLRTSKCRPFRSCNTSFRDLLGFIVARTHSLLSPQFLTSESYSIACRYRLGRCPDKVCGAWIRLHVPNITTSFLVQTVASGNGCQEIQASVLL